MTKISIIVPIYNSSKYLDKCLNSLVNQTLKDIEIICINDGSTDDSLKKLEIYQKKDKRIKILNQKNKGQASARNRALPKTKGEYILFIDSDDYTEHKMCEKLYAIAKTENYDIVCADYFINNGKTETYNSVLKNKESGEIDVKTYLFTDVAPWMKMYKRDFLIKNNFKFPEKIIYEDLASIPTLAKYHPKVYYLHEAFLHYVQHNNSTMRTHEYKEKYQDIFKAANYLYENLNGCGVDKELEYLIVNHLLYLGSLNFYKYEKYNQINKISEFIKTHYPKWLRNEYIKQKSFKQKILMYLFYHQKYNIIKLCQQLKG